MLGHSINFVTKTLVLMILLFGISAVGAVRIHLGEPFLPVYAEILIVFSDGSPAIISAVPELHQSMLLWSKVE